MTTFIMGNVTKNMALQKMYQVPEYAITHTNMKKMMEGKDV